MKAVRLAEPSRPYFTNLPLPDKVQCEAGIPDNPAAPLTRDKQHWNRMRKQYRNFNPHQCQRQAVLELDGHKLCSLHGGQVALAHVLGEPCPVYFGPLTPAVMSGGLPPEPSAGTVS